MSTITLDETTTLREQRDALRNVLEPFAKIASEDRSLSEYESDGSINCSLRVEDIVNAWRVWSESE